MTDTGPPGGGVSAEVLVERARGLAPMLRSRIRRTEAERRISPDAIDEIRDNDIFRILQPRMFGGLELDWTVMIDVVFEIAAACGSTGWVTGLGIGHQWFVSKFPIEAQHDVWGDDPGALTFGSYGPIARAEAVDGGYRMSGRWRFASGCDNGAWGLLGVMLPPASGGGDQPRPAFALVPAAGYRIEDDWHAMGLAGTGSKSILCEDVFVPGHRILEYREAAAGTSPGGRHHIAAIYRLPLFSAIPMCICTPPLGILHGAIEDFRAAAGGRNSRGAVVGSGQSMADFAAVQTHFTTATAALDAARVLIGRDISEAQATVAAGRTLSEDTRLRNRRNQAYAIQLAVGAIQGLLDASGGTGLYLDNPIQRAWRDINAAARHIAFSWGAVSTMYGQHALGRPITSTIGY